jgi:hypothetical protein
MTYSRRDSLHPCREAELREVAVEHLCVAQDHEAMGQRRYAANLAFDAATQEQFEAPESIRHRADG